MRKYIIGAIIGFCLSLGIGAHAEVSSFVGRVIEGAFPVTYEDAPIGDGLVIDGTTYLPVRKLGEAMDLAVFFDPEMGVSLKKVISITGATYDLESATEEDFQKVSIPTTDNPKKIQEIDSSIRSIQLEIPTYEKLIESHKRNNRPYTDTENSLTKLKENLAELERQKAEITK